MLTRRPIFVIGFARGGTNLVMNLLLSHPGVCMPRGELHEVFQGRVADSLAVRVAKNLRYGVIRAIEGRPIFAVRDWTDRAAWSSATQHAVDAVLFTEKLMARDAATNRERLPGVRYRLGERWRARLVAKGIDGHIFLVRELARMYPDASFVAIVRDARALAESHVRRGERAEEFARHYQVGCTRLLEDADRLPHFRIVRYEDLVSDPEGTLAAIYAAADLDLSEVAKIRLETKPTLDAEGQHRFTHGADRVEVRWYDRADFSAHLRRDINENQRRQLSLADTALVESVCAESLKRLGYA